MARGGKDEQIRAAAQAVLNSLLLTLEERRGPGTRLCIGAATRGGPRLVNFDLDLLLDWTYDYPPNQPNQPNPTSGTAAKILTPALGSLAQAIRKSWRGTALQILPQCHLTMALALGFEFRRNTGYDLNVVEVHSRDQWAGPAKPLSADYELWNLEKSRPVGTGTGIALVIQISQPIDSVIEKKVLPDSGLDVGFLMVFEPKAGPSKVALQPSDPLVAHRMAVAVTESLNQKRSEGLRGPVHLFATVPAPFAVLLGQQLSNVGLVQSYEWSDSEDNYIPSFRFQSS